MISKSDKDTKRTANYRPLSLMNIDEETLSEILVIHQNIDRYIDITNKIDSYYAFKVGLTFK